MVQWKEMIITVPKRYNCTELNIITLIYKLNIFNIINIYSQICIFYILSSVIRNS